MKTFIHLATLFLLLNSCDKEHIEISTYAKLKTKYIYASSTADEPYAYTRYTYDGQGRLRKELNADYPYPLSSSYTYTYDAEGRVWNKKYNAKTGHIHAGITESDFEVIREYKYQYIDDLKIETIYRKGEFRDSVVYRLFGDLVLEEHHYDMRDGNEWNIVNEYDSDGNITKRIEMPDGHETVYVYEDSRLIKTIGYIDGIQSSECVYNYSTSGNKLIRESGMTKITYVNGNVIEYIRYHPTFLGSEWFCHRYDYY